MYLFGEEQLNRLFPFHVLISEEMTVEKYGKSVKKLFPLTISGNFTDSFQIKRPCIKKVSGSALHSLQGQMVIVECLNLRRTSLRGQFEYLSASKQFIFIGSPWFSSIEEVQENDLTLHDFASHDPLIDFLHVQKSQEITTGELKQLLDTISEQKKELNAAARKFHDIALFPMQNPDPLIRINKEGRILLKNNAAQSLTSFDYHGELLSEEIFWKRLSFLIDTKDERWTFEAESGNRTYSFVCKFFPVEGYFNIYGRDITAQRQGQAELQRISLVASANKNLVFFTDTEGKISWINESITIMTGYSSCEAIGRTPVELLTGPLSEKEIIRNMVDHFSAGEPFNVEIQLYHKIGSCFWGRIVGQPIMDKSGKVANYFSIIEDITHEKEQEEQVKLLSLIAKQAQSGVLITNVDNQIVWVNDAFVAMQGYSREEVLGKTPEIFDGPSTAQEALSYIHEQVRQRLPFHKEVLSYRKDGSFFWADVSAKPIEGSFKDNQGYFIIQSDITERKFAEEALQRKEQKYRSIIANMNLGLLEVDLDDRIQFANQSFCDMSGYQLNELIGQKAGTLFLSGEGLRKLESKYELRKDGVMDAYELAIKNKQGESKWWLISGAPRYNNDGVPRGSIGIHLDITKQKALELELKNAKEQAEASTKAKELFLANMSHEIRTPMNAIVGMVNQLSKTKLDPHQEFYLNTIHAATDNLLVIINDILDLSKIEAGMLAIEQIGFEPKLVVGRAMQVMMHRAEEKGILLTNSFCDPLLCPVLIGDPYRLNQVLLNLLSNAIKFTDKGYIDLSCKVVHESASRQTVQAQIKDTGIGMDKAFKDSLFEKFTQEDGSITRRYGGTGLGMSICKEIIELMGGTIEVESEKNVGTTVSFTVTFYKGTPEHLPVKEKDNVDVKRISGKRVLIADDNEMNRLVAATILSSHGVLIEEARNGKEAVEKVKQKPFDVILMDVQMPIMDGIEATSIIRKTINADLPIIALTAFALKGDNERFIRAGMSDYLSKPFEECQLLQVLSQWLNKSDPPLLNIHNIDQPGLLFDLTALDTIARGNTAFIEKMIKLFIEQGVLSVHEIKKAYSSQDFETVRKIAHRLKPSIDQMGIVSLKDEIREIERSAETYRTSERLEMLISRVEIILGEVVSQLKK